MCKKRKKEDTAAQNQAALQLSHKLKAQFMHNNHINFAGALLATLLSAAVNLIISWLLQQIIDAATGTNQVFNLFQLLIISISLALVLIAVLVLDQKTSPRFVEKAMVQYKNMVFSEISKKSISSFAIENTSAYLSALSNDSTSIEKNYLAKVLPLIQQIVMFTSAFLMMLYYSPLLTLAAVILSLCPVIGSILSGNRLADVEKTVSEKNEGFLGSVKDMLTGFSVVKSFKVEKEMMKLFRASNEEAEHSKRKRRQIEIFIQMIGGVTGIVAQFGVFLFGAYLAIQSQEITAGVVIIFVQLMNFVVSPIGEVPQILANRKAALALVDKLALSLSEHVEQKGIPVGRTLNKAIELEHVSFGYEQEQTVLNDISIQFEAGKSYALVGGSGSGKSTLLNLLMGSYYTYQGEIRFDGQELKQINLDSLYDLMSMIQQNVFVFDSSIQNNITMFKEFSQDQIEHAINQAGLSALVEQKGMDYACGENGNGLSGGERQRISIARCLLKGSSVILVDEATAALDTKTALAITNSILEIGNLTKIIVTHRLEEAILRKYDKIFVLQNGNLTEQGTFEELIKERGYFYSLYMVSQ
ncbi:MAG: ABC transporter ATP-binding protein [Thermoclostridium sp.]|nr:ABC transporter ATP-binding protein [Thermoclostridium sp.]